VNVFFGGEAFRDEMLGLLTDVLEGKRRESFGGAALEAHDEAAAERLIAKGLAALGMTEEDLLATRMGGPAKYALAWLARRHTCVGNRWIRERLTMGTATSFAACLRRIENARRGFLGIQRTQNHQKYRFIGLTPFRMTIWSD
jgi:putative transposase